MTTEGWNELLYNYAFSTRLEESDDVTKKLLWLYIPDFTQFGKMASISKIVVNGTVKWTQTDNCAGFKISDKD